MKNLKKPRENGFSKHWPFIAEDEDAKTQEMSIGRVKKSKFGGVINSTRLVINLIKG